MAKCAPLSLVPKSESEFLPGEKAEIDLVCDASGIRWLRCPSNHHFGSHYRAR